MRGRLLACTVAAANPLLSQLEAGVPAAASANQPIRARASFALEPQCAQQELRVLTVRVNRLQGGLWYQFEALVANETLTLRATNDVGAAQEVSTALVFPPGASWTTMTLDMDLSLQPPGAHLRFGDADVLAGMGLPTLSGEAAFDQNIDIVVGAATDGSAFEGSCTIRVDDLLFGPAGMPGWE